MLNEGYGPSLVSQVLRQWPPVLTSRAKAAAARATASAVAAAAAPTPPASPAVTAAAQTASASSEVGDSEAERFFASSSDASDVPASASQPASANAEVSGWLSDAAVDPLFQSSEEEIVGGAESVYSDIADRSEPAAVACETAEESDASAAAFWRTLGDDENATPKRRRLRGKQAAPVHLEHAMASAAAAAPLVRKRVSRPSNYCQNESCPFSTIEESQRRRVKVPGYCQYCEDGAQQASYANGWRITCSRDCTKWCENGWHDVLNKALQVVADSEFKADLIHRLHLVAPAADAVGAGADWALLLRNRQTYMAYPSLAERNVYQEKVLKDRNRGKRKMSQVLEEHVSEASLLETDNDTGMPAAKRSQAAVDLETYARYHAWTMCEKCNSLQPRRMKPEDFGKQLPPTIALCSVCKSARKLYVPQPGDVPYPLRELTPEICKALSPLEVDVGPELRALFNTGYRQHARMINFSWHAHHVESRIERLPDERQREKAYRAYEWLRGRRDSMYGEFVQRHEEVLSQTDPNDSKARKCLLGFLEEVGLECACWPHLFWRTDMCFSYERASNPGKSSNSTENRQQEEEDRERLRRLPRPRGSDPYADQGQEEEENGEASGSDIVNHSVRRMFQAFALAPLLDYGAAYEILHYVYDFCMWTSLVAKKSLRDVAVPMRVLMKNHPMSPMYWQSVHAALIDMVRQCGHPQVFYTFSPYEWTFPYPPHVLDQMRKQTLCRLQLPLHETLHIAHVMRQTNTTFVQDHVLKGCAANGKRLRVRILDRLEFQDGTRKAPTQSYHGSGRAHAHSLWFVEDPTRVGLEGKVSASLPRFDEDPIMHGYVCGGQLDQSRSTPWPVHEGPSEWLRPDGSLQQTLYLHHTQEDHDIGLRAYVAAIMEAIPGNHQDVQIADDNAALHAYLVKYPVKYSDSATDEWFSDAGVGESVAMRVLFKYKPYEPEMVLQMFGHNFRQWSLSTVHGGKRDFIPPVPDAVVMPREIEQYEQALPWRGDDMSLLEFLRKTNREGQIAGWLKQEHHRHLLDVAYEHHVASGGQENKTYFEKRLRDEQKAQAEHHTLDEFLRSIGCVVPALGDFARSYKMWGEAVVAPDMLSWLNDRRCGQWLVLHVPFRRIADFLDPEVDEKVPRHMRYHALALRCEHYRARTFWRTEEHGILTEIEAELQLEGHKRAHRENVNGKLRSQMRAVYEYLSGALVKSDAQRDMERRQTHRLPIQAKWARCIADGSKLWEGRIDDGVASRIVEGDILELGGNRCIVDEVHRGLPSFEDMLNYCGLEQTLPGVRSVAQGVSVYHSFGGYKERAERHGVVAFRLRHEEIEQTSTAVRVEDLNQHQMRFWQGGKAAIDRALAVQGALRAEDAARILTDTRCKVEACFGPPGTGKTSVLHMLIEYALQHEDATVLFACPTAQLASRMRERYAVHPRRGQLSFDTCHAAFGLDEPFEHLPTLAGFTCVVVDEISQLQGAHADSIIKLYNAADRIPALVLVGDKCQMAGYGDTRPWHTRLWKFAVHSTDLKIAFRCKDPMLRQLLDLVREHLPSDEDWGWIEHHVLRKQKAWFPHDQPTVADLQRILDTRPETVLLACTRPGTNVLNDLALEALYGDTEPLYIIDGDLESNPANYDDSGKLFTDPARLNPLPVKIYEGMKIFLTKNVVKDSDYINGMECTIEGFDDDTLDVKVRTKTGIPLRIWRWTDRDRGNRTYYPLRPGYASTILKYQGAELKYVDVWLDACVSGAAYTAISRVAYLKNVHIGGNVTKYHFKPAN